MANQLQKGYTFADGGIVNAAALNHAVDLATALEGIISERTLESPLFDTSEVLVRTAAGDLKKRAVSTLPSGVTSVSATIDSGASVLNFTVGSPTTTPVFHIGLDNQTAGKVLAGPVSGSPTTPAFRLLAPSDLPVATIAIAANDVDWDLGTCFSKTLTAATHNFTFSNPSDGQTIRVKLAQDATGGRHVNWPATVRWPGGVNPVMTPGAGRIDIYTFHYIGALYYGTFDQNFTP